MSTRIMAMLCVQKLTEPACIVNGGFGIYVPQTWAERYGELAATSANVDKEDVDILLAGPEHKDYDEAWQNVLDNYCHEVQGVKHYLSQDGDLFEYPETFSVDDEFI